MAGLIQSAIRFAHDSRGDFFPTTFDALLTPQREADGRYGFRWAQGGAATPARRVDGAPPARYTPRAADLAQYVGSYPLAPGFALAFSIKVFDLLLLLFSDRLKARVGVEQVGDECKVELRVTSHERSGRQELAALELVGVL